MYPSFIASSIIVSRKLFNLLKCIDFQLQLHDTRVCFVFQRCGGVQFLQRSSQQIVVSLFTVSGRGLFLKGF